MIKMNGWTQKSPRTWVGNNDNTIKMKNCGRGISIQCVTEFGYESDLTHTVKEATESVKLFMNRRPQN